MLLHSWHTTLLVVGAPNAVKEFLSALPVPAFPCIALIAGRTPALRVFSHREELVPNSLMIKGGGAWQDVVIATSPQGDAVISNLLRHTTPRNDSTSSPGGD